MNRWLALVRLLGPYSKLLVGGQGFGSGVVRDFGMLFIRMLVRLCFTGGQGTCVHRAILLGR